MSVADLHTAFPAPSGAGIGHRDTDSGGLGAVDRKRKNDVAKVKDSSTHMDHKVGACGEVGTAVSVTVQGDVGRN